MLVFDNYGPHIFEVCGTLTISSCRIVKSDKAYEKKRTLPIEKLLELLHQLESNNEGQEVPWPINIINIQGVVSLVLCLLYRTQTWSHYDDETCDNAWTRGAWTPNEFRRAVAYLSHISPCPPMWMVAQVAS